MAASSPSTKRGKESLPSPPSGLTLVQLASVPLGIGTISPATGAASGGITLTIRGSGFQNGAAVTVGGKTAAVTFKDVNTLTVITPVVSPGPQQIIITNPDGQSIALDAAFIAN
jgi:large repetitive protein